MEKLKTFTFMGMDGIEKMNSIMENFRTNPPASICGMKVLKLWDVSKGTITDIESGEIEKLDLPSSNVLKFEMEKGAWIAIRPSGTAPKIKFYFAVNEEDIATSNEKLENCIKEMENLM